MYAKITNGSVSQYPYTIGKLRRDNNTTSFPKNISEDMLKDWGVYPVSVATEPTITERTKTNIQDSSPKLVDGVWTIGWTTKDKTSDETTAYDNTVAVSNRDTRDTLLKETDWTQLPDVPDATQTKWQSYRQALRDITKHSNWPHLEADDWPVKPS